MRTHLRELLHLVNKQMERFFQFVRDNYLFADFAPEKWPDETQADAASPNWEGDRDKRDSRKH